MRRAQPYLLAALLGALAVCWILITPPGAGADEPSHLVRAGALANGDTDEFLLRRLDPTRTPHQLPLEYSVPEPACYVHGGPAVPVDCAVGTEERPVDAHGEVTLLTTADNYPIWGHAIPALATALPGDGGIWAARLVGAATAIALVAAAVTVAARRSAWAATGVLVALSPMAWSIFGTVNPSVFATAGAVAVWVCLVHRHPGWLLAAGWAALALPRRDGLIWACLIAAAVVVVCGRDVLDEIWRDRRRLAGPLAVIALSTLVTLVWDVTNVTRMAQVGVLAPGLVAGGYALRWAWDRGNGAVVRAGLAAATAAAGALAVAVSFVARPGGWNGSLTIDVIGETRRHLTEAIGLLGWQDVPLPRWSVVAWALLVGVLVVVAGRARAWRSLALAGAALGLAIVTSWMFELQEGGDTGRYWQGRYSLPLLAGIPIALTLNAVAGHVGTSSRCPATEPGHAGASISVAGQVDESTRCPATEGWAAVAVAVAALTLLNVAAWAATRRWAVGVNGTYRPWKWGAELMPVHPLPVLLAHAVANAALVYVLARWRDRAPDTHAQRFVPASST